MVLTLSAPFRRAGAVRGVGRVTWVNKRASGLGESALEYPESPRLNPPPVRARGQGVALGEAAEGAVSSDLLPAGDAARDATARERNFEARVCLPRASWGKGRCFTILSQPGAHLANPVEVPPGAQRRGFLNGQWAVDTTQSALCRVLPSGTSGMDFQRPWYLKGLTLGNLFLPFLTG